MKPAAGILAFIWTFVLVQPSFAFFGGAPAYGNCSKPAAPKPACKKSSTSTSACSFKKAASTACSKRNCRKPSTPGDKECNSGGCNPSLGCSSGNFFIHHYSQVSFTKLEVSAQKPVITNDNRIIKIMSECWHPPEL